MLLRKDKATEVIIKIVSYQFPHGFNNIYDANWLKVKIKARHPQGVWEKIDPCLEAFELKSLVEWFEDLAAGKETEPNLSFTEPCLEFEIIEKNRLRIYFNYEMAPPWQAPGTRALMDFDLTPKDFERIIRELKEELETFPIREVK